MAGGGEEAARAPLHTCELCGQEGLIEQDMRSHMLITHIQSSPSCPFCDLGDLSHSDLQLHVNSAHLDFLTPESEDLEYLEDGADSDWGSLWELDKAAGGAGLTSGVAGSPVVSQRSQPLTLSHNPFLEDSDTEEDRQPSPLHNSPKRMKAASSSSPKLDKSLLSLPIRSRPTGGHSPVPEPGGLLTCPLCAHTEREPARLERHVNTAHLDCSHQCPLCELSWDSPTRLQSHVNTEHGEHGEDHTLMCPVCGQRNWSSPRQLQAHVDSHFSPQEPSSADSLLAAEIQRKEEQAEFASLQAQYGMDEQGNYVQQSVSGLRKAVVSGKLSVVDYYERSQAMAVSERSGEDDGSSLTRNVTRLLNTDNSIATFLVRSATDHYASSYGDKGWGCGYRNMQMLLSCLFGQQEYREVLSKSLSLNQNKLPMPSISKLQRLIETAWQAGFDRMGCEQLGGRLSNTRKWIGATEIFTFLSYCNIDCQMLDFHRPTSADGTHPAMFQWLADHFKGGRCQAPVYLQHQGHSRTVVGVEQLRSSVRLLILDPSHSPASISSTTGILRLVRKTINTMKSNQYQLVVVKGIIDNMRLRESRKNVVSTRIPP